MYVIYVKVRKNLILTWNLVENYYFDNVKKFKACKLYYYMVYYVYIFYCWIQCYPIFILEIKHTSIVSSPFWDMEIIAFLSRTICKSTSLQFVKIAVFIVSVHMLSRHNFRFYHRWERKYSQCNDIQLRGWTHMTSERNMFTRTSHTTFE